MADASRPGSPWSDVGECIDIDALVAAAHAVFAEQDTRGDGTLSKAEVRHALSSSLSLSRLFGFKTDHLLGHQPFKEWFNSVDQDHDSRLSVHDLDDWVRHHASHPSLNLAVVRAYGDPTATALKDLASSRQVTDFEAFGLSEFSGEHCNARGKDGLSHDVCGNDLNTARVVFLSHMHLGGFPEKLLINRRIQELRMPGTGIGEIPQALWSLVTLQTLLFGFNNIKKLDGIHHLVNLMVLGVESNQLTCLPEKLGALPDLISIDARGNEITRLPDSFGYLPSCCELQFEDNMMDDPPEEICSEGVNAVRAWMESHRISDNRKQVQNAVNLWKNKAIGEAFGGWHNYFYSSRLTVDTWKKPVVEAVRVMLVEQGLCVIPRKVFGNKTITELRLTKNEINELPVQIFSLTTIKALYLGFNSIVHIPDVIGDLVNLEELFLNNNQLAEVSAGIGRNTQLKILRLGHNKLTSVPATIAALHNLEFLGLPNNLLTGLPESLSELPDNCDLVTEGNPLVTPPLSVCSAGIPFIRKYFENVATQNTQKEAVLLEDNAGNQLSSAQHVLLPTRGLLTVPQSLFGNLRITLLNLNDNKLMSLPDEVCGMEFLTDLYVSMNRLVSLPERIGSLVQMRRLKLDGNRLKTVPLSVFHLTDLEILSLADNLLGAMPEGVNTLPPTCGLDVTGNPFDCHDLCGGVPAAVMQMQVEMKQ